MRYTKRLTASYETLNDKKLTQNVAYFRSKKLTERWTDEEKLLLLKGVQMFGLHDGSCWSEIRNKFAT